MSLKDLKFNEVKNANEQDASRVIFGMPFRYNKLADPSRNTFTKTFMEDGPIFTIVPGIPKFRKNDSEIKELLKKEVEQGTAKDEYNETSFVSKTTLGLDNDTNIAKWLLTSQKNNSLKGNRDLRYYHFEPNFSKFKKYLDVTLFTLGAKMGIATSFSESFKGGYFDKEFFSGISFSDAFPQVKRGIKFYANKNLSGSNAISNAYGESAIAGAAKSLSDMAKEAMFVFGFDHSINLTGSNESSYESADRSREDKTMSAFTNAMENVKLGSWDASTAGDIKLGLTAALSGSNLVFPEIWKDSQYTKSISASFTFVSPYGTPEAIFHYVYLPFCILLTLAAPRQVGSTGYAAPFLLRVDCPGHFTSDLAVITSLDWTIGGSDGLYSKDGLPLSITCNVGFKDLYPALMISDDWGLLRQNTGLHGMLDNMAGLSLGRFTPLKDIEASIKARTMYAVSSGSRQLDKFGDIAWNYRISFNKILGDITGSKT